MIVKKIPIFQGFSGIETIKKIADLKYEFSDNSLIFFDIETTGLSRVRNFVYLIGAVRFEEKEWILYQWMAENQAEEPLLLEAFGEFLKDVRIVIHFNGNRFDQPFLEERCAVHGMDSLFHEKDSVDIYQKLHDMQKFLKLSHMRQTDLEGLLDSSSRKYCDGGVCTRVYRSFMKDRNPLKAEEVLGHNEEDLIGMGRIFSLCALSHLSSGTFSVEKAEFSEEEAIFIIPLEAEIPTALSNGTKDFYLTVTGNQARLLLPIQNGRLKQFYSDYKAYDYLPGEDTAIPKVLSKYMDRSLKIPAKKETCYTWVNGTEDFKNDRQKQTEYLRRTLPCLLDLL